MNKTVGFNGKRSRSSPSRGTPPVPVMPRTGRFHGMTGVSFVMQSTFEMIRLAGRSAFPVLITGETGTGKELAARAVHAESRRSSGPFVPVNCGALPDGLLESELFGHVAGAFTGAVQRRKGRFELAFGGTLFLDEVADLSPSAQVKLLRVLENHSFEHVGGEATITTDVRIVAAANKDLRAEVRRGTFREDLFYRLNVVPIVLAPLRERREDISVIAQEVLDLVRIETGKPVHFLDPAAVRCLERHSWPGNVRELTSALRFAAIRCKGDTILQSHLPSWNPWSRCAD